MVNGTYIQINFVTKEREKGERERESVYRMVSQTFIQHSTIGNNLRLVMDVFVARDLVQTKSLLLNWN